MLKIDVLEDEGLQEVVKKFISSVLPHENYDSSFFLKNLEVLLNYVHPEEFSMEYYLLVKTLVHYKKLKTTFRDYEPRLEEDAFKAIVESSVMDLVIRPEVGMKEWLEENGLESNLQNDMARENACQILWQRCVELYEECFELTLPSNMVMNYEPELRESFKSCISQQSINAQVAIIRGSVRIGRRHFSGFDDWIKYSGTLLAEMNSRLGDADGENTIMLNSIESSQKLLQEGLNHFEPIANWGIPELDDRTPMARHTLVVAAGNEGIGKTKFAVDAAVNVLLAGKKVAYMCGETEQAIVYADVIINYVWKKFGYILRPEHVFDFENAPDEIRKVVGMTIDELVGNSLLTLCESFNYETLEEELSSLYETTGYDVLFIDHSCALTGSVGGGSLKEKVDKFADDVMKFRKHNPVCIVVNSHLSTDAKDRTARGKEIMTSPTKGSSDLSYNADHVFVLSSDETLDKQGLIRLENSKRRRAPRLTKPIFLQKKFEVSAFVYDEGLQATDNALSLEKEQALKALQDDVDDAMYSL